MRFAYRRYEVDPLGNLGTVVRRPEVPLRVISSTGDAYSLRALVDTGADTTLLPRQVADVLGLVVDDRQSAKASGVAGQEIRVAAGHVMLEIADEMETYRWRTTVGFVTLPPGESMAILGHEGCLDFFTAIFDGERHELELRPNNTFPTP